MGLKGPKTAQSTTSRANSAPEKSLVPPPAMDSMDRWGASIPPALSAVAKMILSNTLDAMQSAEELGGPEGQDYVGLMGAIKTEAETRIAAFKAWAEEPLATKAGAPVPHSPSPWREDDGAIYAIRENGDRVRVADTYNEADDIPEEEANANAKILTAAPDSHAVCEELIHGGGSPESLQRAIDLARVALGLDQRPS